jgi:hypothetical protein
MTDLPTGTVTFLFTDPAAVEVPHPYAVAWFIAAETNGPERARVRT